MSWMGDLRRKARERRMRLRAEDGESDRKYKRLYLVVGVLAFSGVGLFLWQHFTASARIIERLENIPFKLDVPEGIKAERVRCEARKLVSGRSSKRIKYSLRPRIRLTNTTQNARTLAALVSIHDDAGNNLEWSQTNPVTLDPGTSRTVTTPRNLVIKGNERPSVKYIRARFR